MPEMSFTSSPGDAAAVLAPKDAASNVRMHVRTENFIALSTNRSPKGKLRAAGRWAQFIDI
jgi:hypothetical protein